MVAGGHTNRHHIHFRQGQRRLEVELKKAGLKERFKTMVGGAPVTQRWAKRIGADAFAENASAAVKLAKALLEPA